LKPLTLDVETDTYNKGNPFDPRNKLCCVALKAEDQTVALQWDAHARAVTQANVYSADIIVGFNFKFDYHWLHNNGVNLSGKRIWDVQAAHYILTHQTSIFPSLNEVLEFWGFPLKLDVVKVEYWEKGITTSLVPWDTLREYAVGDVDSTYKVFVCQWEQATPAQRALILLDGDDMHVLREMEYNGLKYNHELCIKREREINNRIEAIEKELSAIYPQVLCALFRGFISACARCWLCRSS